LFRVRLTRCRGDLARFCLRTNAVLTRQPPCISHFVGVPLPDGFSNGWLQELAKSNFIAGIVFEDRAL